MYQPIFPLIEKGRLQRYSSLTEARESLKQDFIFLLYTTPGSWPGRPLMGIGIKEYLFENNTSPKWQELRKKIPDQVARYLPAIEVLHVSVEEMPDHNLMSIIIYYKIDSLGLFNEVIRVQAEEAMGISRTAVSEDEL